MNDLGSPQVSMGWWMDILGRAVNSFQVICSPRAGEGFPPPWEDSAQNAQLEATQYQSQTIEVFFWWIFCLLFFFFFFKGLHPGHMEVPRLGVESELKLPATATATPDPSLVCNPHHSSWQCWIPNPLSRARDWTHIFMNATQVRYHWATMGTPNGSFSKVS